MLARASRISIKCPAEEGLGVQDGVNLPSGFPHLLAGARMSTTTGGADSVDRRTPERGMEKAVGCRGPPGLGLEEMFPQRASRHGCSPSFFLTDGWTDTLRPQGCSCLPHPCPWSSTLCLHTSCGRELTTCIHLLGRP